MLTLESRTVRVISEQLGVDPSRILPSTLIGRELGADSLDRVELVMALEDGFQFEIPGQPPRLKRRGL